MNSKDNVPKGVLPEGMLKHLSEDTDPVETEEWLQSLEYVVRSAGPQRAGFLLERLNSFLIVKRIQSGASPSSFGHNLVMSDGLVVSGTQ